MTVRQLGMPSKMPQIFSKYILIFFLTFEFHEINLFQFNSTFLNLQKLFEVQTPFMFLEIFPVCVSAQISICFVVADSETEAEFISDLRVC